MPPPTTRGYQESREVKPNFISIYQDLKEGTQLRVEFPVENKEPLLVHVNLSELLHQTGFLHKISQALSDDGISQVKLPVCADGTFLNGSFLSARERAVATSVAVGTVAMKTNASTSTDNTSPATRDCGTEM